MIVVWRSILINRSYVLSDYLLSKKICTRVMPHCPRLWLFYVLCGFICYPDSTCITKPCDVTLVTQPPTPNFMSYVQYCTHSRPLPALRHAFQIMVLAHNPEEAHTSKDSADMTHTYAR